MELGKITSDELIFTNGTEDDITNTYLKLDDYDWMNYTLLTQFRTKKYGTLKVDFEYFGITTSTMNVEQIKNNVAKKYEFFYSTDIFEKYIKMFLNHHIVAWDSGYAFNGEDDVLAFYNEVIEMSQSK